LSYAILQVDIAPSVDQLKRAFKSLKSFTEADVVKLAREACGILVKNISLAEGSSLQRALQGEGVPTELVEAKLLPSLPAAKFVRRMDFQTHALLVYDPIGRPVPVPWQHLLLLSAGAVRHFDVSATRTQEVVNSFDPIRGFHSKLVTDVRHKVEDDARLLLDIFLTGGAMRFQVEVEGFLFKYCFDRPELNVAQKLGLLIQMLCQHAPQATVNRGAAALREGSLANATYASKAALFDESTWLLWRLARNR